MNLYTVYARKNCENFCLKELPAQNADDAEAQAPKLLAWANPTEKFDKVWVYPDRELKRSLNREQSESPT